MAYLPNQQIRIPPTPAFVVLTDRDDGTEWVLSHDSTGEYVAINDAGLVKGGDARFNWQDIILYGPYDGPIVPSPSRNRHYELATKVRLLVRGGFLGYEEINPSQSYGEPTQARILTRRGLSRTIREIIVPEVWERFNSIIDTDILAWEDAPE